MKIFTYITLLLLFTAAPLNAQNVPTLSVPSSQGQIQLSFAPIVKKVSPAVVNIYTKRTVTRRVSPFMNDPFFNQFFGRGNGGGAFGGMSKQQVENSLGSGVIVNENGLVVTNAHVIKNASEIKVILSDGREFDARLTLKDEASDLAVLRIDTEGGSVELPYAALTPSENIEVGDLVLAIGNPFGVGQTVTSGIVSAQGRSRLNINDFNFFIQTDAAINPGNSGGPLVDLNGGVIGINTAIYSRSGGSLGIGFAIPSEMVQSVIAAENNRPVSDVNTAHNNNASPPSPYSGATKTSNIVRPWLGVSAQNVTADIANSLGLTAPRGALVAKLHRKSPFAKGGIVVGDVITGVNGKNIRDVSEMKFRMATVSLGDFADVNVMRKNTVKTFRVRAIAPPDDPDRAQMALSGQHILNGAVVARINPAVVVELGLDADNLEGVAIIAAPRGSYAQRVVKAGDIILEVNGKRVKTPRDIETYMSGNDSNAAQLTIKSNGRTRRVVVR